MTLTQTLMERDGITKEKAEKEIARVRKKLLKLLDRGEDEKACCILETELGLEPDYLMEVL